MRIRPLLLGAFLALAGLAFSGTAQAGMLLNGTFGFTPVGDVTQSPTNFIGPGTTQVTFPSLEVVNSLQPTYLGNPNEFLTQALLVLGSPVTLNPLTLSGLAVNGGPQSTSLPAYLSFGTGNRFTFDAAKITATSTGPGNMNLTIDGIFHDALGVYNTNDAQLSFGFTQSNPGSTLNVSASFSTPVSAVPEPATLGLSGLGLLLGAGAMLRGRLKKA